MKKTILMMAMIAVGLTVSVASAQAQPAHKAETSHTAHKGHHKAHHKAHHIRAKHKTHKGHKVHAKQAHLKQHPLHAGTGPKARPAP